MTRPGPPGVDGARPRVLIVTPFYPPAWRGGGPIRSLAAMTAQHGNRHRFTVLTSAYDWGAVPLDVDATAWVHTGVARVRYLPLAGLGSLTSVPAACAWVRAWREATTAPSGPPDITYLNGVFPPLWAIAPLLLRRIAVLRLGRVVIAPRGEFGEGALQLKAAKKARYLAFARRVGLFRGVVWHASSPAEEADIRRVVPDAQVVVRQNETELPEMAARPGPAVAADDSPVLEDQNEDHDGLERTRRPLRLIYLGRLSPKKGVEVLLEALPLVTEPVVVTVAGAAAEPAYEARLRKLVERSPHPVTFTGGVEHHEVTELLREHDLFVFPTANENFGHTIAESLAAALPVMVTAEATPWPLLLGDHTTGALELVPDLEPATWAASIDGYARRTPAERRAASDAAANAYDVWRADVPRQSVFELVLKADADVGE